MDWCSPAAAARACSATRPRIEFRAGETQLDAAMKLLEGRVARAFVSVRADQTGRPRTRALPADRRSRRHRRPHRRHQRRVRRASRRRLAGARLRPALPRCAHARHAARSRATPASMPPRSAPATTACPSRCAPSTSRARASALAAHIAAGRNCPRKFLINAHTQLLDQPNPRALDNVNTVDEYERAMSALSASAKSRHA